MREKILLMGGPGTGKTHQLMETCRWVEERGKEFWVLDMEDKVNTFLLGPEDTPKNLRLSVALNWEEVRALIDDWKTKIKPGNWVAVDRVDILWPMVQRWYVQERYKEELADRMLKSAKAITGSAMMIPRFAEGAWQVINEHYDYVIFNLLYGFRCHVLLTAGVRAPQDDVSPYEVFSNVGVAPRGQKELPHQPNTALLLSNKTERDRIGNVTRSWYYTTAKDIKGREYVDQEMLLDFTVQYLERYCSGS